MELDTFIWDQSQESYLKQYRYDKQAKTLMIYVTPSNGENLNENGTITIGKIKIKAEKEQNYGILLTDINLVDGTYKEIKEEIKQEEKTYTYVPKAVPTFKTTMNTSKQDIFPGEEFEVLVDVSEFSNIEQGIVAFAGQLEYNQDILERVSIEGQNSWNFDENSLNQSNLKFVMDSSEFVDQKQTILKLKMKVKNSIVVPRQTTITLKNISASNGKIDIASGDAQIVLNLVKENEPGSITSNVYKIEDGFISRILPKTRVSDFRNQIQTTGKVEIVDQKGNILGQDDYIGTGMKIKVGTDLEYTLVVTGDVTGSGMIALTDFAKMKLHYIEYQLLEGAYQKAADIDGNSAITLNDIAQIKLVLIGLATIQ